ncbi:uncharacterized protein LOC114316765 [Camellia sinensis]|uniref:uncharacterized protein LOC114316765 n=1 Tax=Camellia sinensis TaxID=4442 RepID=UPI001035CDBF|nr:uncharacterized protein LOC114316765 [Camellia sinensis]
MAQIKNHKEMRQMKSKAKTSLFAAVSYSVFTRIMTLKTSNGIWDFLKKEYEENERVKGMQVLNLIREFEMRRMKGSETIKDYSGKLLDIVNKVRLLGTDFSYSRIVQKILVSVPKKFKAIISSIENSKDMLSITSVELLNALQAQEQRRLMRQEGSVEGAFQAILQNNMYKKEKHSNNNNSSNNTTFTPCPSCKKSNHPQKRYWWRPDIKCHKCDSGCTSHMTYDQELLKELDKIAISKVRIGNGAYLAIKGKGTVVIKFDNGTEYTSKKFNKFCENEGIEHQLTALYTPQQNVVVERKNRTLTEMTRCLLHDKGLPKIEAANTVKRDKLDKKAEPGIFVGCNSVSKAYRIYFPQNNKRCNVAIIEPAGYEEAAADQKWMAAMKEELKMIEKNQTWMLVDKPAHKKAIRVKWVYMTKLNPDGSVNKHKARLVVKGYAQTFGVDFSETFALVARLDTIRTLLALVA